MNTRFIRASRILSAFAVIGGLSSAPSAHAITIDDFLESQSEFATSADSSNASTIDAASAIGGKRTFVLTHTNAAANPALRISAQANGGFLFHSQDATVTGQTKVTWDGDSDPLTVNYDGLGTIDLTEDGATEIQMDVLSFDFPSGKSIDVTFVVYDAADPNGGKASFLKKTLNQALMNATVSFPFADFVKTPGASTPASFASIGAIELLIEGQFPDVDLTLAKILTNGNCPHVPVGGVVLDLCGVCGGDNSTCKDCLGVPNGPALPGTMCDTGDVGICKDGDYNLGCGCDPRDTPKTEICDGLDNDCDGQIDEIVDQCGVCGGDNSTCSDCLGTPNGTAKVDRCGVCGGDGTSCTKCDEQDITRIQGSLDGTAKKQEKVIKKGIRLLTQLKLRPATIKALAGYAKQAHALQLRNWIISWQLPSRILACPNTTVCVDFSNQPILDEYRTHADELLKINAQIVTLLKKNKLSGRARTIDRAGTALYTQALNLASTVPVKTQVCTLLP